MKNFFIHLPMKMGPIEGSETSAFRTQTPGNYQKENILHKEHGESLKSRKYKKLSCLQSKMHCCGHCVVPRVKDRHNSLGRLMEV